MVIPKWLSIVFCIVFVFFLGLSITSTVLLGAVYADTANLQQSVDSGLADVNLWLDTWEQEDSSDESIPTVQEPSIAGTEYLIQAVGDKICVFTAEGDLIRTWNVPIHMLPKKDRELLTEGIRVSSWDELVKLFQDYNV